MHKTIHIDNKYYWPQTEPCQSPTINVCKGVFVLVKFHNYFFLLQRGDFNN